MTDLNVDDFCKDAARALIALYDAFPRRHTLFVEDLAGPDRMDEFGLHSPRHLACLAALVWLAEEGFLRFVDTIRQEAVDQAVLTGQAFTLLSAPAGASGTRVDELRGAVKERSSTRTRAAVMALLEAMVSGPRRFDRTGCPDSR